MSAPIRTRILALTIELLTLMVVSLTSLDAAPVRELPFAPQVRAPGTASPARNRPTYQLLLNRWYSPQIGRFLSRDPIGFDGGQINLYAYVANRPVSWNDPAGLSLSAALLGFASAAGEVAVTLEIKVQQVSGWIEANNLEVGRSMFKALVAQFLGMSAPKTCKDALQLVNRLEAVRPELANLLKTYESAAQQMRAIEAEYRAMAQAELQRRK